MLAKNLAVTGALISQSVSNAYTPNNTPSSTHRSDALSNTAHTSQPLTSQPKLPSFFSRDLRNPLSNPLNNLARFGSGGVYFDSVDPVSLEKPIKDSDIKVGDHLYYWIGPKAVTATHHGICVGKDAIVHWYGGQALEGEMPWVGNVYVTNIDGFRPKGDQAVDIYQVKYGSHAQEVKEAFAGTVREADAAHPLLVGMRALSMVGSHIGTSLSENCETLSGWCKTGDWTLPEQGKTLYAPAKFLHVMGVVGMGMLDQVAPAHVQFLDESIPTLLKDMLAEHDVDITSLPFWGSLETSPELTIEFCKKVVEKLDTVDTPS